MFYLTTYISIFGSPLRKRVSSMLYLALNTYTSFVWLMIHMFNQTVLVLR